MLDGDQGYVNPRAHERVGHWLGSHRSGAVSVLNDVDLTTPPAQGDTLAYDTAAERWEPSAGGIAFTDGFIAGIRAGSIAFFYSDFTGGAMGANDPNSWASNTSGNVGAGISEQGHPGVVDVTTGASASGNGIINSGNPNTFGNEAFMRAGGTTTVAFAVKTPTSLSDATNRYWTGLFFGERSDLNEFATAAGVDGFGLLYKDDVNGGKWLARMRNSGTDTDTDTGVTVAANTWVGLKIVLTATNTKYYVDSTLVATHDTSMPAATTIMAAVCGITKTAGTSPRVLRVDAAFYLHEFTTARPI